MESGSGGKLGLARTLREDRCHPWEKSGVTLHYEQLLSEQSLETCFVLRVWDLGVGVRPTHMVKNSLAVEKPQCL